MAYKVSTLKKWPNFVTRINLGEVTDVIVRVNNREELLELLKLTRQVTVRVNRWLGDELAEFKQVDWCGPYDKRLARLWPVLTLSSRLAYAFRWPELAIHDAHEEVRVAALDTTKDPAVLETFSRHPDYYVRFRVARNEFTPPNILRQLAGDSSYLVRGGLIRNPNCPRDVLEKLAAAPEPEIRATVARREDCPEELLKKLMEDPVQYVREDARATGLKRQELSKRIRELKTQGASL